MDLQKIKVLCSQKNIRIKDLCEKIGMTDAGLYKAINNGKISSDYLEKIAKELNVPVGVFFGEENKLAGMMRNRLAFYRFDEKILKLVNHWIKDNRKDRSNAINEYYNSQHFLDKTFGPDYKTDDFLIYTYIELFRKMAIGKDEFVELKNNGVISADCCKILILLSDNNFDFGRMIDDYEKLQKWSRMEGI